MTTPQQPILSVITTRTRFYASCFRNPSVTTRQRYVPYPQRCTKPAPLQTTSGLFTIPRCLSDTIQIITKFSKDCPAEPTTQTTLSKSPVSTSQTALPKLSIPSEPPKAEELRSVIENDGLIPKPLGEPGRRKQGFNVEDSLLWPESEMADMKKLVHKLASQHLDITTSFSSQNKHAIEVIQDAATAEFPRLRQYRDNWPVTSILKLHLKNTSCKHRQANRCVDANTNRRSVPRRSRRRV